MPRKIPTQVDQSLSRLLRGGYLKDAPISYPTMLAYPPPALTPRRAFEKKIMDAPFVRSGSSSNNSKSNAIAQPRKGRQNSAKKIPSQMPKLFPQPIVYLADRVRQRFYEDHPWEALRPRTLVEGSSLQSTISPPPSVSDLSAWGQNPGPEEVVACTLHVHRHHSLSLSQAYHHTLSSYHALRAEHEHASRSAVLEARAYGAVFAVNAKGKETAAVEIERGYRKETQELEKGAAYFAKMFGPLGGASTSIDAKSGATRTKSAFPVYSRGQQYLKVALEARDGVHDEVKEAPEEAKQAVLSPPEEVSVSDVMPESNSPSAVPVGVAVGSQGV